MLKAGDQVLVMQLMLLIQLILLMPKQLTELIALLQLIKGSDIGYEANVANNQLCFLILRRLKLVRLLRLLINLMSVPCQARIEIRLYFKQQIVLELQIYSGAVRCSRMHSYAVRCSQTHLGALSFQVETDLYLKTVFEIKFESRFKSKF